MDEKKIEFTMQGGGTLERDLSFPFKLVNYDEDYQPLTEQDKENQKLNQDFLKAWQNNDQDKIDDILAEEVPKTFDNIKLPPMPTDEELEAVSEMQEDSPAYISYAQKIEDFVDKLANSDEYINFIHVANKGLALDALSRNSKSFKLYRKMNPKLDAVFDLMTTIRAVAEAIFAKKYHMDKSGLLKDISGTGVDKRADDIYESQFQPNFVMLVSYIKKLKEFNNVKLGDYVKTKEMTAEHKEMLKEK